MTPRRQRAERRGRAGEEEAALFLRRRGWTILATRVRTAAGEVDLVARRDALLAFVEVKWRASPGELDFAIDAARLTRVAAAAEILAPRFVGPDDDIRIDVVLIAPGTPVRHIENAWTG